jgi:hypothetical protein
MVFITFEVDQRAKKHAVIIIVVLPVKFKRTFITISSASAGSALIRLKRSDWI